MTLLYFDQRFLNHDTGNHPECDARLRAVDALLNETKITVECGRPSWTVVPNESLHRIHTDAHVQSVKRLAQSGGGRLDPDTVVSQASYDVARFAAGAACDAVSRVVTNEDSHALCVVRPPGHHALPGRAMGFCLFNNIAVAALEAIDKFELDRVLIVDWDVHHGNGTQDTFYHDPRVGFFSIHRWPFYPGTGAADETGTGDGLGTTCNLPISFGTSRREYLDIFRGELAGFADRFRPDLVLISAGFDSHREDPIGSLGLEVEDFAELSRTVSEIAGAHADGRIISLLEGGYHPQRLAECVAAHLRELIDTQRSQ